MLYFISYVRTTEGNTHDHHDFKNTFREFRFPLTVKDIQNLEKEICSRGETITIISFQQIEKTN